MTQYHKITAHADTFCQELDKVAYELDLTITHAQKSQLLGYLDNLLLWSKAYNLTAITEPSEALVKHIFDCMAVVPDLPFFDKAGIRLLDIGTGAGLPSVVIAILRPDWHITALDSNSKKIRFIRQMVSELGLPNLEPVASRIQDFAGEFEVITSRAFASLADFTHLASPYLALGGVLYAMKGKPPSDDDLSALSDWHIDIKAIHVPKLTDDRCVVYLTR